MRCDIIIPAFNAEKYIGRAIESALAQPMLGRIIVVDDGSTDCTAEIASSFKGVTLLRQKNRGQSAARNSALTFAGADTVIFLDADDELLPDAVNAHHRALSINPNAAMAFGSNYRIDSAGGVIGINEQPSFIVTSPYQAAMSVAAVPSQCMYRLKPLLEVGGYNDTIRYSEDFDLNIRICSAGVIVSHGEFVLRYRAHESQATKKTSEILSAQINIIRRHFGRGGQFENMSFYRKAKRRWLVFHSRNIPAEILRGIRKRDSNQLIFALKIIALGMPYTFVGLLQGTIRKILSK